MRRPFLTVGRFINVTAGAGGQQLAPERLRCEHDEVEQPQGPTLESQVQRDHTPRPAQPCHEVL